MANLRIPRTRFTDHEGEWESIHPAVEMIVLYVLVGGGIGTLYWIYRLLRWALS